MEGASRKVVLERVKVVGGAGALAAVGSLTYDVDQVGPVERE